MVAERNETRLIKVGTLVALALFVMMAFLFFIGSERKIFSRKAEYKVRMETVSGLAEGNPVQLSGVTIGSVREIRLPEVPEERRVDITITVDRNYSNLIRYDSRARVRKLGLIAADSYVDITPGSPEQPVLPPGSVIPAQRTTDVDRIIASGEDLVDNLVQISYSLKNVLQRVDAGEGLIGELTTEPETQERITDRLLETLNRANSVMVQVQSGRGAIGKLIYDEDFGRSITVSVQDALRSIASVTLSIQTGFESGEGIIPALLHDPQGRVRVEELLATMQLTAANLAAFTEGLSSGEGLLPRLIEDRDYADDTLAEFNQLIARLNETARQLAEGEGTAGRLISDPTVYESINDILIGINESRMLRWLIRNRQAAGIRSRFDAAQQGGEGEVLLLPDPLPPPPVPEPQGEDATETEPEPPETPNISSLHRW
jgi:phospholipid/cholesterol/gamma-HCH transport system substrate-binding protein